MSDDDLRRRFAALSIDEFRRRVALAVGHVRELRSGLAVHVGMKLEQAPGAVPEIDRERAERAFHEITELLPLRRAPLSPEERARVEPIGDDERERMKVVLEAMAEDPEAFDAAAGELGLEVSSAAIVEMRDNLRKVELLGELQREIEALTEELRAYKEHGDEEIEALKRATPARRAQN